MPLNWLKRNTRLHDTARPPLSRFGLYGLVTLLVALIAAGSYIGAQAAGKEGGRQGAEAAQRIASTQLAKGCGRTQLQRGYLWLRAREFTTGSAGDKSITTKLAPHLFRIVWCERTYAVGYKGSAIYLPRDAQACFLKLERDGYWNDREPHTDPDWLLGVCANRRR